MAHLEEESKPIFKNTESSLIIQNDDDLVDELVLFTDSFEEEEDDDDDVVSHETLLVDLPPHSTDDLEFCDMMAVEVSENSENTFADVPSSPPAATKEMDCNESESQSETTATKCASSGIDERDTGNNDATCGETAQEKEEEKENEGYVDGEMDVVDEEKEQADTDESKDKRVSFRSPACCNGSTGRARSDDGNPSPSGPKAAAAAETSPATAGGRGTGTRGRREALEIRCRETLVSLARTMQRSEQTRAEISRQRSLLPELYGYRTYEEERYHMARQESRQALFNLIVDEVVVPEGYHQLQWHRSPHDTEPRQYHQQQQQEQEQQQQQHHHYFQQHLLFKRFSLP